MFTRAAMLHCSNTNRFKKHVQNGFIQYLVITCHRHNSIYYHVLMADSEFGQLIV